MSSYSAPLKDMKFLLKDVIGLAEVGSLPGCEDATPDTADAILEEAAKFAGEVLDPLNVVGDREGPSYDGATSRVKTSPGFKEAYRQFCENGWNGLGFEPEWGGQGLPKLVSTPVLEMLKSANLAFSLCPMLTQGAIEALVLRGSEQLKTTYLRKMVAGTWTGTMNLTEPQAGSDLSLVRTRAERHTDAENGAHYRLFGQKIFITWGEHDVAENIIHLVLARTPDAPEGVKGISLFVVPKFLPKADGTPGRRNDVRAGSIEHKLGIHGSPTAVMLYGDKGEGAVGFVVGEENRGLEYMFIMMNAARFVVGLEGVALAERAFQRAVHYASERLQGRDLVEGRTVPIIRHPDIRRMLMLMKSQAEATRALAYDVAAAMDIARLHPDETRRKQAQGYVDLMIPVVKGWSTEAGLQVASLGVQVHGGMGFIEETGAAQHLRDARITTIYEGTTGIQANDLLGRKLLRDGGGAMRAWLESLKPLDSALGGAKNPDVGALRGPLAGGAQALIDALKYFVATAKQDPRATFAGAVPFLMLTGHVAGGAMLARSALVAERKLQESGADADFLKAKIATARFFAEHILTQSGGLRDAIVGGASTIMAIADDKLIAV